MRPNPFSILKLSLYVSNDDIRDKSEELLAAAQTEEEKVLINWARDELMGPNRPSHELFEMPCTRYEYEEWERFKRKFQRNPLTPKKILHKLPVLTPDDIHIPSLIGMMLKENISIESGDIMVALSKSPYKIDVNPQPLEVSDVLFG